MAYQRRVASTAQSQTECTTLDLGADVALLDKAAHKDASAPSAPISVPWTPRLLHKEEVPNWYSQNEYIILGYRPVLASVPGCFHSLRYWHNESINIYSHLIPAAIALLGNYGLALYFNDWYPNASLSDRIAFHVFFSTSMLCFGMSSAYHTMLCHSEGFYSMWLRLDYTAIVVQIVGSFISGLYVCFYCEPALQWTYWTMIVALGALTCFVVLHPALQHNDWRMLRLASFIATGFSAIAPLVHAASIFSYDDLFARTGLGYYFAEGGFILGGCVFYATRFPEAWKPERFDICGASHQLFHVCVVLGAVMHFLGVLSAFDWNYHNARCISAL